jgi:hypothetical protein
MSWLCEGYQRIHGLMFRKRYDLCVQPNKYRLYLPCSDIVPATTTPWPATTSSEWPTTTSTEWPTTTSTEWPTTTSTEWLPCMGLLYNWYAATDARNICAAGWRVATGDILWIAYSGDTGILLKYLDPTCIDWSSAVAAIKMKEDGYWPNSSLFNGRGSGMRGGTGVFSNLSIHAYYWTASEFDDWSVDRSISELGGLFTTPIDGMGTTLSPKYYGHSIRLIKESTSLSNGQSGTYTGNDGKVYRTICIGTQEWLSCNLEETKYRNGDPIPEVTNNAAWAALVTGGLCAYDNDWGYTCH